jgi:hypothetical protein
MLGTVIVRHRGFIAIVEAAGTSIESGEVLPTDLAVEEHPEGGANALNLNRCLLSLPLSHIHRGHDHKTLITVVLENFHSCQLWSSLVESSSFLIIFACCVQPPHPPTQAASWSCPATLRCRGATECRCIGEFHVGREPYTA